MKNKVTVNLWIMPNAGFGTKETIEQELSAFNKEHPEIDVRYKIISWSFAWEKIIQAVKSKTGPDVLQIGNSWTPTLNHLVALKDITVNVQSIKRKEKNLSSVWKSCQFSDNSIKAVPWFCDLRVLFYRKSILRNAGLTKDNLNTWDSFCDVCKKIHTTEINGETIYALCASGQKESVLIHDLSSWVWNAGGNFLNTEGTKTLIDSPESIKGILFYLELVGKGYIPSWAIHQNVGEVTQDFFIKNRYAMCFSSTWPLLTYLNPTSKGFIGERADDYDIALVPKGSAGRYTFLGGSNLGITSFSKVPEEAWELVKYLTSFDSQVRYSRNIQAFPAYIDAFDFSIIENKLKDVIMKSYKFSRNFPNHFLWGSIEQTITDWFAKILKETVTSGYNSSNIREEIKKLAEEIDCLLSMYKL